MENKKRDIHTKKTVKPPGRGSEQFVIRFPEGMRERLALLARANGRSMNAELVRRLEESMAVGEKQKWNTRQIMAEIASAIKCPTPIESWTVTLGRTGETMTLRQYMDRINQEFMDQFAGDAKYPPW